MTEMTGNVAAALYLDLLADVLTRSYDTIEYKHADPATLPRWAQPLHKLARRQGMDIVETRPVLPENRLEGKDWPAHAETMVGLKRLRNIRECVEDVLRNGVPGDLVETGIWRGGTCIYMRAILAAYGCTDRKVWCADSFQGLPKPDSEAFPQDTGDIHHTFTELAVSRKDVEQNFDRFGLLDEQVKFLEGWFSDTLPNAPIDQVAVLRLDGDMYQSTWEALTALYSKIPSGGWLVVDDYGAVPACKLAIDDFRRERNIVAPMQQIDWTGVCWQVS